MGAPAYVAAGIAEIPAVRREYETEQEAEDIAWEDNLTHSDNVGLGYVDEDREKRAIKLKKHDPNLSVRTIAEKVGAPKSNVHRWLSVVPSGTTDTQHVETTRVVGTDGKRYPATKPREQKDAAKKRALETALARIATAPTFNELGSAYGHAPARL